MSIPFFHSTRRLGRSLIALALSFSIGCGIGFNISAEEKSAKAEATELAEKSEHSQSQSTDAASGHKTSENKVSNSNPAASQPTVRQPNGSQSTVTPAKEGKVAPPKEDPTIKRTSDGRLLNWPTERGFTFNTNANEIKIKQNDLRSNKFATYIFNNNGQIQSVFTKKEHEKFAPATMTKLFSVLLAYDKLNQRLNEETDIIPSDVDGLAEVGARIIGFKVGESLPIADLFLGAVMESGADAIRALARLSYGDENDFVKAMNEKAKALGMNDSHFSNCTGLSADGDSTSVHDMAIVMALCATRPQLVQMLCTAGYTTQKTDFHPYGIALNSILFNDIEQAKAQSEGRKVYIQGGRPGWSPDGLFNLMTFAHVGKKLLVVVSAGADQAQSRFADHDNIYNQLIGAQHDVTVLTPHQPVGEIKLINGRSDKVELANGPDSFTASLPVMLFAEDVDIKLQVPERIDAPVKKGQEIGQIQVNLNGRLLHTTPAIAAESYRARLVIGLASGITAFYQKVPYLFVLILLVLIALTIFYIIRLNKKQALLEQRLREEAEARLAELERKRRLEEDERRWQELNKGRAYYSTAQDPYRIEKHYETPLMEPDEPVDNSVLLGEASKVQLLDPATLLNDWDKNVKKINPSVGTAPTRLAGSAASQAASRLAGHAAGQAASLLANQAANLTSRPAPTRLGVDTIGQAPAPTRLGGQTADRTASNTNVKSSTPSSPNPAPTTIHPVRIQPPEKSNPEQPQQK